MKLTEQAPAEVLIDWAKNGNIVKWAWDRPWFQCDSPIVATEMYQPPCRCHHAVKLKRYHCEDGNGHIYIGQCDRCETIIWSYLECSGK